MIESFLPVVDRLQQILDVRKPGDLPEAVRALQKKVAIYSVALDEFYDSGAAIKNRADAIVREWENE